MSIKKRNQLTKTGFRNIYVPPHENGRRDWKINVPNLHSVAKIVSWLLHRNPDESPAKKETHFSEGVILSIQHCWDFSCDHHSVDSVPRLDCCVATVASDPPPWPRFAVSFRCVPHVVALRALVTL